MTSQESFACLTTKYEQIAKLETVLFCKRGRGGGFPSPSESAIGWYGILYYYIIYKYLPLV